MVLLRQHGLRPLLRPDSLVIPGDLLPLPPQNAPARGDQQYRDQGDGQPRPADHTQHAQPVRLHRRGHTLLVGADGVADSLRACAQFRFYRLLVLAECGFQHLAGTLLLRFRLLLQVLRQR